MPCCDGTALISEAPLSSLAEYIRANVSAKAYYESVFPSVRWPDGGVEPRVKSPFREDRSPSMSVNPVTGAWCDHGGKDKFAGNSILSFHAALEFDGHHQDAARDLYATWIHPVIDDKLIRSWHRKLKETPSFLRYVVKDRFVSMEVIEQLQLGTTGDRIVFPVKNEFGMFVDAKLYLPGARKGGPPKMIHYTTKSESRSFGSPTVLYPISALTSTSPDEPVIVTEGEWDMAALITVGMIAVTGTGGCKSWPKQYNELFRSRDVAIAYDNDEEGEEYYPRVVKNLQDTAKSIKHIAIPKAVGKDVTDWIRAKPLMRRDEMWRRVIAKASVVVDNPSEYVDRVPTPQVALDQASRAEHFHKRIRVDALVTGKDTAPYILPKRFRVTCSKKCDECPLADSVKPFREKSVDTSDPEVLSMIDAHKATVKKTMITLAGLPIKPQCRHQCEVVETFNVEQLLLIPTLDDKTSQYVVRPSYFVGHGLRSNRAYRFEGVTTVSPESQHATHLFDKAQPVQGEVETFELTTEIKSKLKKFQCTEGTSVSRLRNHLRAIAAWQSRHVTKILKRDDLHTAVDIAFHSVAAFKFNGEPVPRGMIDALILGDTRCGKGKVTEGLTHYYGLGEVASGENCSFAGLVGGCESIGKRFIVKWGIIPLNNGRLVVIDEASALSEEEFGHMSRVRSEGVAEISKIVREQTQANTRLLWLSNPRSGRPITSYNNGVQAIKELVGANEDISRFDFALTVASNEVASSVINTVHSSDEPLDPNKYPKDLCRSLVLWAWSRTVDQVEFTTEATKEIIDEALAFGQAYSSAIPLVQSENIRIKLAKVSAAIAARVFSTDDGTILKVERVHVQAACSLLREFYSKSSMGYDTYSSAMNEKLTVQDPSRLVTIFAQLGDVRSKAVRGMLELQQITADTLSDFIGDLMTAKTLLSDLVQAGCITRFERGNWYFKTQAFNQWLRDQARKDEDVKTVAKR